MCVWILVEDVFHRLVIRFVTICLHTTAASGGSGQEDSWATELDICQGYRPSIYPKTYWIYAKHLRTVRMIGCLAALETQIVIYLLNSEKQW